MLDQSIKDNIESIDHDDLEKMFKKFQDEHGEQTSIDTFVTHLFNHKLITASEFKHIQSEERVDVSDLNTDLQQLANLTNKDKSQDKEEFTIVESIDEGAMGEILIAKDNNLHRTVAYKKIHPHVAEMPSFLGRFYKEAQVTAQLQHPNIVPVYGLTFKDGAVGYVMKLIDGITLKAHLQETMEQYNDNGEPDEHHTLHARLEHFLKVCDAIHYAHRKGVVHRDLKPLNIMIGPYNEVYVMDWGIAKTIQVDQDVFGDQHTVMVGAKTQDTEQKTALGQVMGTPAYMSPEQAAGENDILDHRSDLYSLGLILHELVTFYRAIQGKTSDELMMKARRGHIDEPPAYGKQADEQEQLLAIVKKATQYMPEDRYATVAEFADDIRRFMHGEAIHARPESNKQKIMRWVQNNRKKAVNIMAYTILFCFASVSLFLLQQMRSMQSSHDEEAIVNEFSDVVIEKAQSIDRQFLTYQGILEGIAASASNLYNQGSEDTEKYYTNLTIDNNSDGAPDYNFSDIYGFPISTNWHVYKLAPGISEKNVEPLLRKLNPLRHSFKSLLIKSYKENLSLNDNDAIRNAISVEGLPLAWAHVGLENGILADYPGKTGYPNSYDPRQRPWYRLTMNNNSTSWLKPYVDVGGRGLVLPCTSPLYDNSGNFIGVAAVELTLDYIKKEMMNLKNIKGLEETYLLNENAEIIVRSSQRNQSYEVGTVINKAEELEIFDNDYIVNKVSKQSLTGKYSYIEKGREKTLAFHRLGSTGWYFVSKVDAEELHNAD